MIQVKQSRVSPCAGITQHGVHPEQPPVPCHAKRHHAVLSIGFNCNKIWKGISLKVNLVNPSPFQELELYGNPPGF